MKTSFQNRFKAGITTIEGLVVLVVLGIFVVFILLPSMSHPQRRSSRIGCVNNLKQIGLAFRIYAGDNRDRFPMNISTNDQPRVDESTPVLSYFNLVQNELGTPKILLCPDDAQRKPTTGFTNLNRGNLSYFVGLDGNENSPESILAGDRNITNGFASKDNVLYLTTNQPVGFTAEIHKHQGNIAMGDGSVQQISNLRIREVLRNSPFATNRIKLP